LTVIAEKQLSGSPTAGSTNRVGMSEQDGWMQQQGGAYKQTQQQPSSSSASAEVGSLEEALGAFGLAHLWPVMQDEEMDVETYIMLEYQDLVDLGVEPCVSRATSKALTTPSRPAAHYTSQRLTTYASPHRPQLQWTQDQPTALELIEALKLAKE
jgi:hypothetical protein